MKVIFLDIDGVLNSINRCFAYGRGSTSMENLDPTAIKNLNILCVKTDSKVVISSSWRRQRGYNSNILQGVFLAKGGTNINIIGETGEEDNRATEVATWLKEAKPKVKKSVVLDDQKYGFESPFIRVDQRVGLTYMDVENAIEILNGKVTRKTYLL